MTKNSSGAGTLRRRSKAKPKPQADEQQIASTLAALDQLHAKTPQATKMISLLKTWLGDDSGYDEQVWPLLKKSLNRERARVGARRVVDE